MDEPPLFASLARERQAARFRQSANRKESRASDDYYPTPPAGTRALLTVERFNGPIWEPACGGGHMSETLQEAGYDVISTDLVDRGYGRSGVDFLLETKALAPNIVTNPPYVIAEQFVEHALALATGKVAMLLRLSWLEGVNRGKMFRRRPPARVWVFSKRLTIHRDTTRRGGGMAAYCWIVWDPESSDTRLGWINPVE